MSCRPAFAVVLVADAESRPTALGLVRSLSRGGVPVAAVAASRSSPTYWSRCVRRRLLGPPLEGAPDEWIASLARFGASFDQPPVLFASADEHVLAVHRGRARLSPVFRYPFLAPGVLAACLDKRLMYAVAAQAGIETGRVVAFRPPADPDSLARRALFPAVLKPAAWTDPGAARPGRDRAFAEAFGQKAVLVRDREALGEALHRAGRLTTPLVLQEYVPGPSRAIEHVSLYADAASTTRGLFTGRKTRQYPPLFGNAALVDAVPATEAAALAQALVAALGFHGLAGAIEFKRHPATGRLHFVEINPRASASIALAAAAGVNLPLLAYRDLTGSRVSDDAGTQRPARWIDVRSSVLARWSEGRQTPEAGTMAPAERPRARHEYAYWAADDPVPALVRAVGTPGDLGRAAAVRVRRRR